MGSSPYHLLPDVGDGSFLFREHSGARDTSRLAAALMRDQRRAQASRTRSLPPPWSIPGQITLLSIRQARPLGCPIMAHHINTLQGSRPAPQASVFILSSPARTSFICSPGSSIITGRLTTRDSHSHHNGIRVKTPFTSWATGPSSPTCIPFTYDTSSSSPSTASRTYLQPTTPLQPQT